MSTPIRTLRGTISLALLLMSLGCGEDNNPAAPVQPAPVASVHLDVAQVALVEGDAQALVATPRDAQGMPLTGRQASWQIGDNTIASVSAAGVVTAIREGATTVTATIEGRSASIPVTVAAAPVASISLNVTELELEEGEQRRLVATLRDAQGRVLTGRTITWSSSEPAIATVGADGTVKAIRTGAIGVMANVGTLTRGAVVRVKGTDSYALLFESRTGPIGRLPQLYRVDLDDATATPELLALPSAGTWHVSASPDGSKIAFAGTHGNVSSIFVANADGSNVVQLTTGPDLADQPVWSPDGLRIAYRGWKSGGPPGIFNPADIWVMHADGSGKVNLTATPGSDHSRQWPSWSPRQADGSYRIAYAEASRGDDGYIRGRVFTMRSDGLHRRPVSAGVVLDDQPSWSPDGQRIVFTRTGVTALGDLWIVDATGANEREVFAQNPDGEQFSPKWSPDGKYIAFTSKHELDAVGRWSFQIYTVRPDGTQLVRRTHSGEDRENPAWVKVK